MKLKLRTTRRLYTLTLKDAKRADKIVASLKSSTFFVIYSLLSRQEDCEDLNRVCGVNARQTAQKKVSDQVVDGVVGLSDRTYAVFVHTRLNLCSWQTERTGRTTRCTLAIYMCRQRLSP